MSWLFDSIDELDHLEAAGLCAECPAIEACRRRLREVLDDVAYRGVQGTWAGQLYGRTGKPRPRALTETPC